MTPTAIPSRRLLECVHCGLCLEACPTYTELGTEADSPRGRIHLLRAVVDQRLPLAGDVVRHLDLCLGCRACETACPSGVRYGELIEGARAAIEERTCRPPVSRLLRRVLVGGILPYPRRLALALAPVRLLDRLGARFLAARLLPGPLGRSLALLPRARTGPRLERTTEPPAGVAARDTVGLLAGCVMPVLYPDVNAATAQVLAAAGHRVIAPPAGCCGAIHLHAGDRRRAMACARQTIDSFARTPAGGDLAVLVTNAAGCGAMMREYGALLADDPAYAERARAFALRVRDVSELLAAAGDRLPLGPLRTAVTYHDACHLAHGQGVVAPPRTLLALIPELELRPLAEADFCCGSAGTYNLTEPAMAERLLARKVERILATGADVVVTGNPGCMLQIEAGLRSRGSAVAVWHTVEAVARSLASGRDEHHRG
jgi:glycolate oxidase iron-sulfur subunit